MAVVLAEADDLAHAGLEGALRAEENVRVVGAAANDTDALQLTRSLRPAVVVLSVSIGGPLDAGELTSRLTRLGSAVLVLAPDLVEESVMTCLAAGALGYLTGSWRHELVGPAVREVGTGRGYLDPDVTGLVLRFLTHTVYQARPVPVQRLSALTARERQVLTALAEGMPPERVAAALSITLATVRSHISHILRKLGVGTMLAAVAVANQGGLLEGVERGWS